MPKYGYKCSECGAETEIDSPTPPPNPPRHCNLPAKRIFNFAIKSDFKEGFNPSLGMYVSNRRQMNEALKVGSDQVSEHTQLTHSFVMRDPEDHAAFGLSDADVAEAKEYGERLRRGEMPTAQPLPQTPHPNPSTIPQGVKGGWENPKPR